MWTAADITILIDDDGTDHPVLTAEIETPAGRLMIMGAVAIDGRTLRIDDLHLHGVDMAPNGFGARQIFWLAQAVMEAIDVDQAHIAGARRTTGATPGRRPGSLRFVRARPPHPDRD